MGLQLQLIAFVSIYLLITTASAISFFTFPLDEHVHSDEAVFRKDEIGCPGIPTLQAVDLKKLFGDWYLPYTSDNWMSYKPMTASGTKKYDPREGPGGLPRPFGALKKPLKKSKYAHTCIKSSIRPMPPASATPLPVKRWQTTLHLHPTPNVVNFRLNETGTGTRTGHEAAAAPKRDYSNIWIRTKCPLTGQEFNHNCRAYPETSAGVVSAHSRIVCVDFVNPLAPPSEFYIVDTDNESYALVVSCVRGAKMNSWAIFVKARPSSVKAVSLSPELVKELLSLVEHIGFMDKAGDIIETPYAKCKF